MGTPVGMGRRLFFVVGTLSPCYCPRPCWSSAFWLIRLAFGLNGKQPKARWQATPPPEGLMRILQPIRSQGVTVKKSHKVFAAAAAGALVLTAGATAAANAGPGPAPAAVPAVDVQPAPGIVVQQNRISVGASFTAVNAALAKCQADKLPFVTVALVDRFGTIQALLRGTTRRSTPSKPQSRRHTPPRRSVRPRANWPSGSMGTARPSQTCQAPCSWREVSR